MCVCVCVHIYIYTYSCIFIYVCIGIYSYISLDVYMCVCLLFYFFVADENQDTRKEQLSLKLWNVAEDLILCPTLQSSGLQRRVLRISTERRESKVLRPMERKEERQEKSDMA